MTVERKMIAWETTGRWIGAVIAAAVLSASLPARAQLGALGNQLLHQDSPGILETAEIDDSCGRPLAAGDFNGNGIDDLAIGTPFEDLEGIPVD